jgi:uncharacterized membrane protein
MPRFKTDFEETFIVPVSQEVASAHFGDLETIARNYGPLESWKKLDEDRLHLRLAPISDKGVTFHGEHVCAYQRPSAGRLTWKTTESSNLWSQGEATFTAEGASSTRVRFRQTMEVEMKVNALLAKVIAPIVNMKTRQGIAEYLQRMRATLPGA